MKIEIADKRNFSEYSLDDFQRYQVVRQVYRRGEGELVIVDNPFEEDWTLERRRVRAQQILSGDYLTFCAFEEDRVAGFLMLIPELYDGRLIVYRFYISREFRRKGYGRALFAKAKEEAKKRQAHSLFISACPAKETIDFYLAMGCFPSDCVMPDFAHTKPHDIPMECLI